MDICEYMKNHILILDGGMGTILQEMGLMPGEQPEKWNISHPDEIQKIHAEYFRAGSNVVITNTFGANSLKFPESELEEIIRTAIENAKIARDTSNTSQEKFIALDIGPTGRLLAPFGDFDFEDAVSVFSKTVKIAAKYGVDLIFIETMNDSYETKAALLAAKESCDLPVFVSNAYGEDGKLMTGASPEAMAAMLCSMGADAIGANCSLGPNQLKDVIKRLLSSSTVPVLFKPNAGLPVSKNGKTVFDVAPEEFSTAVAELIKEGVSVIGGCCGTTPEYIRLLAEKAENLHPALKTPERKTVVSSYTHCVEFGKSPVLIGERINPTGKKKFKEALRNSDTEYILNEGIRQQNAGAHILDVNVGLPEIDECAMLKTAVCELQAVIDLPLQIDTSDSIAMETALRRYNGKALINSVNGKAESMEKVFPLVKKYGGVVVALTLDEAGIPETADGRVEIAEKILKTAKAYGIDKSDIIFDTLAMSVSADKNAAKVTLEALKKIRYELGVNTSLGISNISFGLPKRDVINSEFFAAALENGLSAAIMNPFSFDMMKTYYAYNALHGYDENCSNYIDFISSYTDTEPQKTVSESKTSSDDGDLKSAIEHGLKEKASELTKDLLKVAEPLKIVTEHIIPSLNKVGDGFEKKTVYLPQLLMSAEAAKSAFEQIKSAMPEGKKATGFKIVLATVHGDIHDIGKNIVRLLLENYGFEVFDLGKDVPPEKIVEKTIELNAPLAGLSALMTTTVPAMEETIKLLRKNAPWCKVVVGGAVLTKEYADSIGADKYAKDAMETVRYAQSLM